MDDAHKGLKQFKHPQKGMKICKIRGATQWNIRGPRYTYSLHYSEPVAAEGGGGLEPPQLFLQNYMCVTSSTSREQYCFKQYS